MNCLKSSQIPIFAGDLPFDPHVFAYTAGTWPLLRAASGAGSFGEPFGARFVSEGRRSPLRQRERTARAWQKKQWLCEYIITIVSNGKKCSRALFLHCLQKKQVFWKQSCFFQSQGLPGSYIVIIYNK